MKRTFHEVEEVKNDDDDDGQLDHVTTTDGHDRALVLSSHDDDNNAQAIHESKKRKKKDKKKKKKEKLQHQLEVTQNTKATFFNSPGKHDYIDTLELKTDITLRPLWVCPDRHIFLETFSPVYQQAYDFLVAIAEPVSRPENIHEYMITTYSLYAAVSIGLDTEKIIQVLEKLSKVKIPDIVIQFIRDCTGSFGKVKLVLQKNSYFVESPYPDILLKLLGNEVIADAAVPISDQAAKKDPNTIVDEKTGLLVRYRSSSDMASFRLDPAELREKTSSRVSDSGGGTTVNSNGSSINDVLLSIDEDEDEISEEKIFKLYTFEIYGPKVEHVKSMAIKMEYPMLEEYDFRNDTINPNLPIDLNPTTQVRSYQEKSLSKMFSNGRARSGIIVLPCGAGKTLVGITATCTVKKSTLVLCINALSVEQWRNQFKKWSNIDDNRIVRFTSLQKDSLSGLKDNAEIVITTYNMITYSRSRNEDGRKIMESIQNREWGLMVLDEVHVAPAEIFRKVIGVVKAHCKLGLTATLLREDEKTEDLYFLIGPKLYEANWLDLQRNGHLAKVQCVEIWCPMTSEFAAEYLSSSPLKKKLLYVLNPNKFRACEFLVRSHEQRRDKIIVFSDNVFALEYYAKKMGRPFIVGETHQQERMRVLAEFQRNPRLNTVFISKVGDTAIDLPEATVIIQISSHFGSRRQEAQRLGRILRPKNSMGKSNLDTGGEASAYFYSLVTQDTQEMFYSSKRQQFLLNQGYSFQIISDLHTHFTEGEIAEDGTKKIATLSKNDELDLLRRVLQADDAKGENERIDDDGLVDSSGKPSRRTKSSLSRISGVDGTSYFENSDGGRRGAASGVRPYVNIHPLFKKRLQKKK